MRRCPACGVESGDEDVCRVCGQVLESSSTESFGAVPAPEREAAVEDEAIEGPVLVVRKGPEVGERFYIDKPELTIGRDPEADIFLNDVTISRHHASLSLVGEKVLVRDAGSLNGTYVNGVCVDSAELQHGDALQIGRFQMIFIAGGTS